MLSGYKFVGQTIVLILLFCVFSDYVTAQQKNINGTISISQNGEEVLARDGIFQIINKPFEVIIDNVSLKDNIAIFAYHSDEMFNRYDYPIRTADTVMFAPGTSLAMSVEKNISFFLRINEEYTQNYFPSDRRINHENQTILRIKGFADTLNRFQKRHIAYLSIFIDYNKNGIIEKNEISNIIIKVNQVATPPKKIKVYISTMGSRLAIINSEAKIHNQFVVFKISSQDEAKRFSEYMRKNTNYYRGYQIAGIVNIDYDINNKYFIMSPRGLSVEFYQPYHFSGEFDLIFDVLELDKSMSFNYVSLRTYTVAKDDDIFSIKINLKGKIASPIIVSEY